MAFTPASGEQPGKLRDIPGQGNPETPRQGKHLVDQTEEFLEGTTDFRS
jgi:hypothetical protein